jgi:hypothetical protein
MAMLYSSSASHSRAQVDIAHLAPPFGTPVVGGAFFWVVLARRVGPKANGPRADRVPHVFPFKG